MALITCPECEQQLSDKAFACPHCGYPMTAQENQAPKPKIRTSKHPRLPNGFGQISELKNKNLRNRFRAMITVSKTSEGKPICKLLKPKAYFATYNDAFAALMEYNKNPYDLDDIITVDELYEKWSKEYYKTYSPSAVRKFTAAWKYCEPIKNMKIVEAKPKHLKTCIDNASLMRKGKLIEASSGVKNTIKVLFNSIFDYAVEYDLVDKNYSRMFTLEKGIQQDIRENRKDHLAFNEQELKILWDNIDNFEYVGYILFQCYSGLRPTELCLINTSEVNLKEGYMIGGIKTTAGRDRIIPIHPKVKFIVEREYERAKKRNSPWLFTNIKARPGQSPKLSYDAYKYIFYGIMKELRLDPLHKPHDPRKTFVTLAKKYNMNEFALKRIVGHAITDITESVYTERSIEWYLQEMQKIK